MMRTESVRQRSRLRDGEPHAGINRDSLQGFGRNDEVWHTRMCSRWSLVWLLSSSSPFFFFLQVCINYTNVYKLTVTSFICLSFFPSLMVRGSPQQAQTSMCSVGDTVAARSNFYEFSTWMPQQKKKTQCFLSAGWRPWAQCFFSRWRGCSKKQKLCLLSHLPTNPSTNYSL